VLFCNHVNGSGKTQVNTKLGPQSSSRERKGSAYDDGEVFLKDLKNLNGKLKTQWIL